MAPHLRVVGALGENPSVVPVPTWQLTTIWDSRPSMMASLPSSVLHGHHTHIWYPYIHAGKALLHIKIHLYKNKAQSKFTLKRFHQSEFVIAFFEMSSVSVRIRPMEGAQLIRSSIPSWSRWNSLTTVTSSGCLPPRAPAFCFRIRCFLLVSWINHQRILCLNKLGDSCILYCWSFLPKEMKWIKIGELFTSGLVLLESIWISEQVALCQWQMEALRLPCHHPLPFMVSRDFLLSIVTQLQNSCCLGSCLARLIRQLS